MYSFTNAKKKLVENADTGKKPFFQRILDLPPGTPMICLESGDRLVAGHFKAIYKDEWSTEADELVNLLTGKRYYAKFLRLESDLGRRFRTEI